MGRPPLPIGERGDIKRTLLPDGRWQALCRYRDTDGQTRRVKATGPSGQKAENALKRKLKTRPQGEDITSETRLSVAAEHWFASADKSPGTKETYRRILDAHIIPGIGELRLREATTARLDGFIRAVSIPRKGRGGPVAANNTRAVLALIMGMCARYDAIPSNPVRDTLRPKVERKPVATMSPEQFQDFYNHVTGWASGNARRSQQMLDAIDLLIATGCRPGELLALRFSDTDFKAGTITITGTLQRAGGLHRQPFTKTRHQTTLTLPSFALSVLRRRKLAAEGDMVFTSTGGGLWLPSAFSKSWIRARGDEWAWVKPSSFRKIVATMIERESGSVAASRQLGHVNDSITKLHYIAPDQSAVDSKVVLERFRGDA